MQTADTHPSLSPAGAAPASRGRARFAGLLLLAFAAPCAAPAQGLDASSPFLPQPAETAQAQAPSEIQLAGITTLGGRQSICLVDVVRKKTFWIPVGGSENGIEALSCDLEEGRAQIRVRGEARSLALRKPANAGPALPAPRPGAPATPAAGAQPPPPIQAMPVLAPVANQQPPQAPLPSQVPGQAPDIGPAGGVLPPVLPLTTQEEKEREARMLVSDLMEIGMRQRKAYEEAQRKAKADAGANRTLPATQPPATTAPAGQ